MDHSIARTGSAHLFAMHRHVLALSLSDFSVFRPVITSLGAGDGFVAVR